MSKLMCNNCLQIFKSSSNLFNKKCPIDSCYGKIVEIDELILPSIIELNKKGYMTNYCCSGHIKNNGDGHIGFYITFEDFYPDLNKYKPDDFIIENTIYGVGHIKTSQTLRHKSINDWERLLTKEEQFELITEMNLKLYKFVKTLPEQNLKKIKTISLTDEKILSFCNYLLYDDKNVLEFYFDKSELSHGLMYLKNCKPCNIKNKDEFFGLCDNIIEIDPYNGTRIIHIKNNKLKSEYETILSNIKVYPEILELYKFI